MAETVGQSANKRSEFVLCEIFSGEYGGVRGMEGMGPGLADRKRKEREKRMIEEGTELLRRRKQREAVEKRADQKRSLAMLCSYQPWGRPGGGAPNPPHPRRRPLSLNQVDTKKGLEMTLPRLCQTQRPVLRRSDPILRYQFHEPVRKSIDEHVRYKRPRHEQLVYKQQLDRLVADKCRRRSEELRENKDIVKMTGWTGEPAFQRLEFQHVLQDERRAHTPRQPMLEDVPGREPRPPEEVLTGGVELVPLLARRRAGYKKCHLPSTDVTRRTNGGPHPKPIWKPAINEGDYLKELSTQIVSKEIKLQEARTEDIARSHRHFETWGGLWGRPGHGAPKATTVKENLDYILYRMPIPTM